MVCEGGWRSPQHKSGTPKSIAALAIDGVSGSRVALDAAPTPVIQNTPFLFFGCSEVKCSEAKGCEFVCSHVKVQTE